MNLWSKPRLEEFNTIYSEKVLDKIQYMQYNEHTLPLNQGDKIAQKAISKGFLALCVVLIYFLHKYKILEKEKNYVQCCKT